MADKKKTLDGIELTKDEEVSEGTLEELTNNKGDDE
jgi:hypothetical protein